MPRKILIIPDKFKGTLTAPQAAEAMVRGWQQTHPDDILEQLPMSDGGDGFGEIMSRLLNAEEQISRTVDAAHRPCDVSWWWHGATQTAIIESARIIGLAQLPAGKYHPFELDTSGLGVLLHDVAARGARRCLAGIGGSATNDGGFGVAKALGWQFFNPHSEHIDRWTELHALSQVRPPEKPRLFEEMIVAVDVQNPLSGPDGATRVYGPQKGLLPGDFEFAERCLEQLAEILSKELHLDAADLPGAGAAGGLGFGLRCFLGAELTPGFDLFARHASLQERLRKFDLVLTGEGSIDRSTLMGKGVGEIARLCREQSVPCLGLCGVVEDVEQANHLFSSVHALAPEFTDPASACSAPQWWLERLTAKIAAGFTPPRIDANKRESEGCGPT